MDRFDRNILNSLQADSRQSYASIGEQVGLSVTAVKDRIDKLSARGVLQRFSIDISGKAAGYDVMAFVFVAIDRPEDCQIFENNIADIDRVQECHHVTGAFNYLLKVIAKDMADLENLLSLKIKLPNVVSRTETTIVFSSAKHSHFINCSLPEDGERDE